MAIPPTTSRPQSADLYGRIACAVLIVLCLSAGPGIALTRWVTDVPFSVDTWPYVYTFWGAAVLGAALFVLDVVAPITSKPLAVSETLLVLIGAPAALAIWTLLSAFWTKSPGRTPSQAVLMLLVVLTAVWFGYALTFRYQVIAMFVGLHLMTLVSLGLASTLQSARLPGDEWVGMFGHPDALSAVGGLGVITAVGAVLFAKTVWLRVVISVGVVADVAVVVMAESVTGWIALGGAVSAFAVVLLARGLAAQGRSMRTFRGVGATIVAAIVVTVPWSFKFVADRLDDSSLSARTKVWDFVFDSVEDRWLVGFGFQSFWDDDPRVTEHFDRTGQLYDSAHSTFFDTLLFLGGIGLLLLLVVVALGVGRVWWEALGGQSWAMAWWTAVATFAFIENVTESMIAMHSIFWVLLIAPGFAAVRYTAAMSDIDKAAARRPNQPYTASYTYQ